jgi:carboxypeptidase T
VKRRRIRHILVACLAVGMVAALSPSSPASGGGLAATGAQSDQSTVRTYRVSGVYDKYQRTAIARTGAAIEAVQPDFIIIRATGREIAAIRALGYAPSPVAVPDDFPPEDARYHNFNEMVADINAVEAAHDNIVDILSIGQTDQGREIWTAKISDNVSVDEDEPEVLFDGMHHAREHLTVEMTISILHLFADGYGRVNKITRLVNSREIFVIFMLNADGGEYDIQGDFYHYWRKNRQVTDPPDVGTDNNRNYGYRFDCCGGSSDDPSSEIYHGPFAFSSPESAALADFVDSRVIGGTQQITSHISYHTFGELILWPYGYTFADVPPDMDPVDHEVFVTMGQAMAQRTCNPGCFTPQQSSDLYITDGTTTDWMYGAHRIFSFTFELYPSCCDFYVDDENIRPQTKRMRGSVLYLVENADCPYEVIGETC